MATFFNNNIQDENENQGTSAPSQSRGGTTGGGPVNIANQNANKKQGSGRFTNIQQYLDANKTGGQQLATGIGNKIQKDLDPSKKETEEYGQKVQEGIQGAQGTLQAGSGNLNQLQTIGSNIQANTGGDKYNSGADLGIQTFRDDPNYGKFKTLQAGNAVNENLLNMQQQVMGNAAGNYLGKTNEYGNQISNEGGRFNLLKQAFGGNVNPQYNMGQQKLDQLLLARQGTGQLKDQVMTNANQARNLQQQAQGYGTQVGNIASAERTLIDDINKQATANEADYMKMLDSYIPKVNEIRDADWTLLQEKLTNAGSGGGVMNAFQKATPSQPSQNMLDAATIAKLGVTAPTRAYNVFQGLKNSDIATKGQQAATTQDVAQQADLDRYNALADIMGMSDEQKRLTGTSQLGDTWTTRNDGSSLTNRLANADANFKNNLQNERAYVNYTDPSKTFGRTGEYDWDKTYGDLLNNQAGGTPLINSRSFTDYDTPLLDFVNRTGYGNVLTPDGMQNIASGITKGQGTWSPNANTGQYGAEHYNTAVDDQLRARYNAILNAYNNS